MTFWQLGAVIILAYCSTNPACNISPDIPLLNEEISNVLIDLLCGLCRINIVPQCRSVFTADHTPTAWGMFRRLNNTRIMHSFCLSVDLFLLTILPLLGGWFRRLNNTRITHSFRLSVDLFLLTILPLLGGWFRRLNNTRIMHSFCEG